MAGVADAVLFAGEQAIDDPEIRVGRWIFEEGGLFRGGRRQADQIEVDAAQQTAAVGHTGRFESPRLMAGGEKRINRVCCVRRAGRGAGDGRPDERFERPERRRLLFRRRREPAAEAEQTR